MSTQKEEVPFTAVIEHHDDNTQGSKSGKGAKRGSVVRIVDPPESPGILPSLGHPSAYSTTTKDEKEDMESPKKSNTEIGSSDAPKTENSVEDTTSPVMKGSQDDLLDEGEGEIAPTTAPLSVMIPDQPGSTAPPQASAPVVPKTSLMQTLLFIASSVLHNPMKGLQAEHRINRMHQVMGKFKGKLPPDSIVVRYWYILALAITMYGYVVFTRTVVFDDTHTPGEIVLRIISSFILLMDFYLHKRFISPSKYSFIYFDLIVALPYEIILLITDTNYAIRIVISCVRALKMGRIQQMFGMSMPDAIDVHYVNFYYQLLPPWMFIFWFMTMLHTLSCIKILCSDGKNTSYHESVYWVWIIMTSAPLNVDVTTLAESILSGFLMTVSMILQGYVVGAMSMLVFSYSVKDENRTQMLVTLEMLKHYQLPVEVQHEVLSFQYHILEDSSMRSNNSAALEKLPPTMLRQIQLYVKVDILNKVKFFDGAEHDCKLSLADEMTQRIVEPEENIVTAGDIGDSMYFMMHGLADVELPNGLCVATIRRGDFFGEIALLSSDSKRKATVVSLTYCDLLELHRENFDAVIQSFPLFREKILEKRNETCGTAVPIRVIVPEPEQKPETVEISELDVASVRGSGLLRINRMGTIASFRRASGLSAPGSPKLSSFGSVSPSSHFTTAAASNHAAYGPSITPPTSTLLTPTSAGSMVHHPPLIAVTQAPLLGSTPGGAGNTLGSSTSSNTAVGAQLHTEVSFPFNVHDSADDGNVLPSDVSMTIDDPINPPPPTPANAAVTGLLKGGDLFGSHRFSVSESRGGSLAPGPSFPNRAATPPAPWIDPTHSAASLHVRMDRIEHLVKQLFERQYGGTYVSGMGLGSNANFADRIKPSKSVDPLWSGAGGPTRRGSVSSSGAALRKNPFAVVESNS